MFFENQNNNEKQRYEQLLKIMGALSKLSSDNDVPYLYYRMAENIFCKAFCATNLARSDISLDAMKDGIGIGLKTFISKGAGSIEKITEFNRSRNLIDAVNGDVKKIKLIAQLRNERLATTSGICGIDVNNMLYHCISRDTGKFIINETMMNPVRIDNIGAIKNSGNNTISFNDGINEYSFNFSKSTLYKRFIENPIHEIDISIFEDPYQILENYLSNEISTRSQVVNPIIGTIYLPLYSFNKKKGKFVAERSGLNQWNANGRTRNYNEVYIPVPKIIHNKFPQFFPDKTTSFTLHLPKGTFVMAKLCQSDDKGLMSNPNKDLGKWILRDILRLPEGQLVTYEDLEKIGIDSVEINKFSDDTYAINFKQLNTYENFKTNELLNDDDDDDDE